MYREHPYSSGSVELTLNEWLMHDDLLCEMGREAAIAYATQMDLRKLIDKEW